jgi:LPXTG-motif cell wall-anchored protein
MRQVGESTASLDATKSGLERMPKLRNIRVGRWLALTGVALSSLAATLAAASPAVAADPPPLTVANHAVCDLFSGNYTVQWAVFSSIKKPLTATVNEPIAGTVSPKSLPITAAGPSGSGQSQAFTQIVDGSDGKLPISFHVTGNGVDVNVVGDATTKPCRKIPNPVSITGVASCAPGAGAVVTWTVKNDGSAGTATVVAHDLTPSGATVNSQGTDLNLPANTTLTYTEKTGSRHGEASITLLIGFLQNEAKNLETTTSKNVALNCDTSASQSAGTGAPSLPVTGTNITVLIAAAAGLLAGGTVLMVLARRRRFRLEA